MRWLIVLSLLLNAAVAAETGPRMQVDDIPTPAAVDANGASLAMSPDGIAWLSWLERTGKTTALRFATFDATAKRWNPASTIARGEDWFVNWADFPALTVGPTGHATAVWFVNNPAPATPAASHDHHGPGYRAFISRTTDAGKTWSAAAPLTNESDSVEFVSLATLADGRVLAVWLDGRAKKPGVHAHGLAVAPNPQQVYSRVIGSTGPDTLVDPSVCDCCQTTLTAFLDGTALLAYRGRTPDEIRDIRVTRFRDNAWSEPRPLNEDNWKIPGCPVNGPQFASDGGRVAVAWFTAADNNPRVLASMSPDAGARFLLPLTLSHVKPAGRVATQLLHDGAILVTWVDADGAVWLHRVTPDFTATEPMQLAAAQSGRTKGFPRMARLRDYEGGKTEAQLLVAFTRDSTPGLRTLLVRVPEGELLEAENNCACAPPPAQLRGFPIRGTVTEINAAVGAVRVQVPEVPGLFAAGARDFKAAQDMLQRARPGSQFLGRVEKRDGAWWLFDLRLLASAPAR